MDFEKYILGLQIEKIEPKDTIIINFSEECDIMEMDKILKLFIKYFPENNIVLTRPELIESIEVKKNGM